MLVLEPVTLFVHSMSVPFLFPSPFQLQLQTWGQRCFFLLTRDHCSLFSSSGIIIMTLLLVAWAIIWLWQTTNENDDSTWHLIIIIGHYLLFAVWSMPQLYLVIGIHSMSCNSTHTHTLPLFLSLPMTGQICEKKMPRRMWNAMEGSTGLISDFLIFCLFFAGGGAWTRTLVS